MSRIKSFNKIFFVLISFFCFSKAYTQVANDMQLIRADHWIYDAMNSLSTESGCIPLSANAPLTVAEIRLAFESVDEEKLSESGKYLYEESIEFLNSKPFGLDYGAFLYGNLVVTPEAFARTNDQIDYSFNYCLKDYFLKAQVGFAFKDYVCIEAEPFFNRNYSAVRKSDGFSNLPFNVYDMEFEQPRWAFSTIGYASNDWGINLIFGKEGLRHGNSLSGSIVYSDSFSTDFYSQLNFYSKNFKLTMDVTEVSKDKFLYMRQFEWRPFQKLKVSFLEGSLVNGPFELRFMNPLMIQHSFTGWEEYGSVKDHEWYGGESHFCAYLCFLMEFSPFRNSRFYFNYAQTELQVNEAPEVPNGLGFQLGGDYRIEGPGNGYFILGGEGIYTSPYLYVKTGADWSLYKRYEENFGHGVVNSWIGTPFGPDCIGGQVKFGYKKQNKWECEFDWIFTAHGVNRFGMFDKYTEDSDGYRRYDYFPGVKHDHAKTDEEKQKWIDDAKNMGLHGTVEYKNQACIQGTYFFNKKFSLSGKAVYTFSFNHNNISDNFQQGIELGISGTYRLFD